MPASKIHGDEYDIWGWVAMQSVWRRDTSVSKPVYKFGRSGSK